MDGNLLPFRGQIEALKTGRFSFEAAKIVVDNLKSKVVSGAFTWEDLGTTSGALDLLLAKLRFTSARLSQ